MTSYKFHQICSNPRHTGTYVRPDGIIIKDKIFDIQQDYKQWYMDTFYDEQDISLDNLNNTYSTISNAYHISNNKWLCSHCIKYICFKCQKYTSLQQIYMNVDTFDPNIQHKLLVNICNDCYDLDPRDIYILQDTVNNLNVDKKYLQHKINKLEKTIKELNETYLKETLNDLHGTINGLNQTINGYRKL